MHTCGALTDPRGAFREIKNATQGGIFDFWQGHLCNSRTNEIHDLLCFGKDVKAFLGKTKLDK